MKHHLRFLGLKAKDRVTEFEGVVESISFDLYGCVQAILRPAGVDKEGQTLRGEWFDVKRLEILDLHPVMDVPDFDKPEIGAAHKPAPQPAPRR